jgi:diguanylate cyclase (GGDEF)-like protein
VTYAALSASVVSLPLLVIAVISDPTPSLQRTAFAAAAAIIASLAVGRTIVSAVENGRLFHAAVTDPLTGLHNHRFFHERLDSELEAARRYGESLSVMWVDIDDFTRLNRVAGHAAGDGLLRTVSAVLSSTCAEGDLVCRVGGDEFAVICRGGAPSASAASAERLHAALSSSVAPGALPPGLSGGIAHFPDDAEDAAALAGLAEHAGRWARGHARGRVVAYDAELMGRLETPEEPDAFEARARLGAVRALASAVDARLEASGTRSTAVAALATALARRLGLDEERVASIETAALVHDVGMVALGDPILSKPTTLTSEEVDAVRRHPALGEQVAGAAVPAKVVPWIRHHHERWDGEGYPDGLRAVAIPLESRILAICDAWDAMISERPYRRAMSAADALAELRAGAGSQFDPELVEPLAELVAAFHGL